MKNDVNVIRAAFDDISNGEINISLVNIDTGVIVKDNCNYYPENTLEQVIKDKKYELGISSFEQAVFVNKKTYEETRDGSLSLGEFGIGDGSVLGIKDAAIVA